VEVTKENFDYSAFGSRLKEAREKAGFTQAQACEAVEIPKAQVLSSYERGISNPPIDTLAALARLYSISLDDLVFADQKPNRQMTTGDWLFYLVCTVDRLVFFPCTAENRSITNLEYSTSGELSWGKNSVYADFFDKWIKLRNAWLDGLIDQNDYYHLVRRHANQVPDDPAYERFKAREDELNAEFDLTHKSGEKKPQSFLAEIASYFLRAEA